MIFCHQDFCYLGFSVFCLWSTTQWCLIPQMFGNMPMTVFKWLACPISKFSSKRISLIRWTVLTHFGFTNKYKNISFLLGWAGLSNLTHQSWFKANCPAKYFPPWPSCVYSQIQKTPVFTGVHRVIVWWAYLLRNQYDPRKGTYFGSVLITYVS